MGISWAAPDVDGGVFEMLELPQGGEHEGAVTSDDFSFWNEGPHGGQALRMNGLQNGEVQMFLHGRSRISA